MEQKYFNRLDSITKDLVLKIEDILSKEINIRVDSGKKQILGCDEENFVPVVCTSDENYFPSSSVFHELLHIDRTYVEVIPRLDSDGDDNHFDLLKFIDGNLEHLVIIPKELEQYPDRKEHWIKLVGDCVSSARANPDEDNAKIVINQLYTLTRLVVPDDTNMALLHEFAGELGLPMDSDDYIDDVTQNLNDKIKLLEVVFNQLNLDTSKVRLVYRDCVNEIPESRSLKTMIEMEEVGAPK